MGFIDLPLSGGGGGGSPTGPAGGSLSGNYPSPGLSATGVTPGTYGSSTQIPVVTVSLEGRVLGVSLATLASSLPPSGPAGGDLSGTYPNPSVSNISFTVPISKGGTGLTTVPTNGKLLIGNGVNYSLSNITAGAGIQITNGAGSITITNTVPQIYIGNFDGGAANSVYGGINPVDGGNA